MESVDKRHLEEEEEGEEVREGRGRGEKFQRREGRRSSKWRLK